jgi:small-conductance mechanosensitive channel
VVVGAIALASRLFCLAMRHWWKADSMSGAIARKAERSATVALLLVALQAVWTAAPDDLEFIGRVRHLNGLALILAITWGVMVCIGGVGDVILRRQHLDIADNLHARSVQTQTRVLARTLIFLAGLLGIAAALMTFPSVRHIGTSLMASAGVSALAIGLAARSVFGNLLAGLQIALTQPIRIDDVLVVENEWGRVEEITATYVVLRIWDARRMILPLQYFIEKPFVNWTRRSADILGTVFLWVDYRMPLEPLRVEAQRLCNQDPAWDRKVCIIQVTDTTERTMQLRLLVSSADSGRNFDLRCRLREGLIAMIRTQYVEFLPRTRAEISTGLDAHDRDPDKAADEATANNPSIDTGTPAQSPTPEHAIAASARGR